MTHSNGFTRRQALRTAAVAGAGAATRRDRTPADVEHAIILIQENRSLHSSCGVRGFGDRTGRSAFFQKGADGRAVQPLSFDTGCMSDITPDRGPQHDAWKGGRMDRLLGAHRADNAASADETRGDDNRADIPPYDAFTVCDAYHCSLIGPTDPHRPMSISAWSDPHGTHSGPLVEAKLVGHGFGARVPNLSARRRTPTGRRRRPSGVV